MAAILIFPGTYLVLAIGRLPGFRSTAPARVGEPVPILTIVIGVLPL
jgi:hypothetical protein